MSTTFYYNIKAKPTLYKGIQYRSRLEATWACFFELAGLTYEYEPFDLPGWSPDFLIKKTGWSDLVEVKPVFEFTKPMKSKIESALQTANLETSILLLGVSPLCCPNMGDLGETLISWIVDLETANAFKHCGVKEGDIAVGGGLSNVLPDWSADDIEATWAQAKNELQFLKPVRSR